MLQPSRLVIGAKARQSGDSVTKHIKSQACGFPTFDFCPGQRERSHQRESAVPPHGSKIILHIWVSHFLEEVEGASPHPRIERSTAKGWERGLSPVSQFSEAVLPGQTQSRTITWETHPIPPPMNCGTADTKKSSMRGERERLFCKSLPEQFISGLQPWRVKRLRLSLPVHITRTRTRTSYSASGQTCGRGFVC